MSRQDELAAAFEQANRDLIDCLRRLDREQWRTPGVNSPLLRVGDEDENRPVGTIAHHVAMWYRRAVSNLALTAAGENPTPPTRNGNARHAEENPDPDPDETIALLEEDGARVASAIRALTADQLELEVSTFIGRIRLAQFVERTVIFHPVWHLSSIKTALAPR